MKTFTFTKVATGGKLEVEGKSEKAVREERNLDPDLWTLDGAPDTTPDDEDFAPPDEPD